MAEEIQTPAEGGNGTPATPTPEDTAAAVQAARDLLVAQGHQVLDSSQFHGIKTEASRAAEAKAAEAQARLDALEAEHQKLAEFKRRIEDKDKSDAQLHAEQRRAWQEEDRKKLEAIETAKSQAEELQKQLERERIQNRIVGLMHNATNAEAALMWADKHVGARLSIDERGELVWTESTGTPHVGVAAKNQFESWWNQDSQKFLRAGNPPGPPTAGAPSSPAPKEDKFVPDPSATFEENLRAADEWDAKKGQK
jgi:hypothetical protein